MVALFAVAQLTNAAAYGQNQYGADAYSAGDPAVTQSSSSGSTGGSGSQQLTPQQLQALDPSLYGDGSGVGCSPGFKFSVLTGKPCSSLPSQIVSVPTALASSSQKFMRDLELGSRGSDVFELQKYLNSHGFKVAERGIGSPGKETMIFGYATRAALIRFQKAKGIKPAAGYFGPITRRAIGAGL
jgi:hypothetical protein